MSIEIALGKSRDDLELMKTCETAKEATDYVYELLKFHKPDCIWIYFTHTGQSVCALEIFAFIEMNKIFNMVEL